MEEIQSPIHKSATVLKKAKAEVAALLSGHPDHQLLKLNMSTELERIIARLYHLSGTPYTGTLPSEHHFPPVTNFMGESITIPKPIKREDLTPEEAEKKSFVDKVNELESLWDSIPYDGMLNTYRSASDQLVIRGVAKRAGVPDYEDREINYEFLDEITKALIDNAANAEEQKRIEEELKRQNELLAKKTDSEEITSASADSSFEDGENEEDNDVSLEIDDDIDLEEDLTPEEGTDIKEEIVEPSQKVKSKTRGRGK